MCLPNRPCGRSESLVGAMLKVLGGVNLPRGAADFTPRSSKGRASTTDGTLRPPTGTTPDSH